jgi:hypothetical protein
LGALWTDTVVTAQAADMEIALNVHPLGIHLMGFVERRHLT